MKIIPEHETGQLQNKADSHNNKQAPKEVTHSGAQASKNSQAKVHVVKDNEEVLGAALGNQPEYNEDGEELVKQTRVNYTNWDPVSVKSIWQSFLLRTSPIAQSVACRT